MRHLAAALACVSFTVSGVAAAQTKASTVFLLEDAGHAQWCAYTTELTWKAIVQKVAATTVGTLTYSNGRLTQVEVTETGESGDWTVYDRYFFDGRGHVVRLSRLINYLPGDRSVAQAYSISEGRATKTASSEKNLRTGEPVTVVAADWLPDLSISTAAGMFLFSALLGRPGLRTSPRSCVQEPSK